MRILLIILAISIIPTVFSQTVTNGNFDSGASDWGCSPETNPESVYGGSGSNSVAEVDAQAQLCQTVSGFTPGSVYRLRFVASRRTSCGPAFQSITISVSGGALSTSISRNSTAFSFDQESFQFTATAASHTITFSTPPSITETCNILVDNIAIQLVSGLPVDFLGFTATPEEKSVVLNWSTASELRNDHYTIERSADAKNWEVLTTVKGAGTTTQQTDYSLTDSEPLNGVSYYRLSQTDSDGSQEELKIVAVKLNVNSLLAYPNPVADLFTVSGIESEDGITILDASGRPVAFELISLADGTAVIDASMLKAGSYLLKAGIGYCHLIRN